ncbi:MAG: GNAT family N-acetyltransferase [Methylotenera sp.]|nr:GNAT family N-acetyltransferase [Oligoflexia bacterium]
MKIQCLYHLQGEELDLIETRRTDLPSGSSPAEVYRWILVLHRPQRLLDLDFVSMAKVEQPEAGHPLEVRVFKNAQLTFDESSVTFELFGKHHELQRSDTAAAIPYELQEKVRTHLLQDDAYRIKLQTAGSALYVLRKMKLSDATHFPQWLGREEVIRHSLTRFHQLHSATEIEQWFLSLVMDPSTFALMLMDPALNVPIGYAGISGINRVDQNGEYFILIGDPKYWNQGIATAVTREMLKFAFNLLGLHRVHLTASSANPGALKAYQRAGYAEEGRLREAFYRNGEFSDKLIFGILKSDWSKIQLQDQAQNLEHLPAPSYLRSLTVPQSRRQISPPKKKD